LAYTEIKIQSKAIIRRY